VLRRVARVRNDLSVVQIATSKRGTIIGEIGTTLATEPRCEEKEAQLATETRFYFFVACFGF
jgi:hypothetical protein